MYTAGNWYIRLRFADGCVNITERTKTDCINKAALIKAEHKNGINEQKYAKPGELTLHQAMESYVKSNQAVLSASTVRSYNSYLKNRFKAYQDKQLSKINWQEMINKELEDVSEKTVRNAWGLVVPAVSAAGYTLPKVKLAKVPIKDLNYLQPEEIKPFMKALEGKPYEIAALLLLHGLRLSEAIALKREDIDLVNDTIRIHASMVRGENGLVYKETNKNSSSTRKVPILIPRLKTLILSDSSDFPYLVHQHPSNVLEGVKLTAKQANVTPITCHDLRRTFATLCWANDIDIKQLQLWGGWSDFRTCAKIYLKLSEGKQNANTEKMKAFFRDDKPKRRRKCR